MLNFDFKRYTPRPKKLLRASLSVRLGLKKEPTEKTLQTPRNRTFQGFATQAASAQCKLVEYFAWYRIA